MNYFYHPEQQAFLVEGLHDIPETALAVTEEQHQQLVDGRASGCCIVITDGVPALTPPQPSPYHEWNGKKWALSAAAQKQQLADAQTAAEAQINDAVYAVQQPLLRFRAEYELRESQARAFAAADYAGEVPSQVAAFATPTGKTAREAAEVILAQAEMLHGALEQLGILRMRKFELAALDSAEAVAGRTAEILAAVRGVAEQLQAAKG